MDMEKSQWVAMALIAGIIFLVLLALWLTGRRITRNRELFAEGEDLFDEGHDHDPFDSQGDDFSSIRIQREEPGPLVSEHQSDPFGQKTFEDFEVPEPPAENVVPLRAPEPAPEPEPLPMQKAEPVVHQEPIPMVAAAEQQPTDYDYGEASSFAPAARSDDWPRSENSMSTRGYDDEEAPFIAPFIRDYIEESERRQHTRLDDMRDDLRRQLSGIRDEQSSRLDLFLNSIDRKLSNVGGVTFASGDDGASTRRRVDSLSSAIDRLNDSMERQTERLSELSRSVEERFADMSPLRTDLRSVHDDILTFRRELEGNTSAIGQMRDNFDGLKEDFGRMERSFLERAKSDGSVTMRLSEVVRSTLDAAAYELNAKLGNGQTADCVISLNGGASKIAIDGSFPIECFNRLPSRDAVRRNMPHAKASEDEFRRTVLRSIFGCADRYIVAGETSDSAILFLPSEAAYTILHDRFPDLVRDSHRARVWLTSPSTLMGTLNLLHNVLPPPPEPKPEPVAELRIEDAGPFTFGPAEDDVPEPQVDERDFSLPREEDDRAQDIEKRLRQLREEEQSLAEELVRRRETGERRYRETSNRRNSAEDFESRLERFSFDIDEGAGSFELDEDDGRRSFKGSREDDLR